MNSSPLKKVDISELLHFFDIQCLHDLLIVEKNPRWSRFSRDRFSNKCNVVTVSLLAGRGAKG